MSFAATVTNVREQARRYSRVTSTQADDEQVDLLLACSINEFAMDVGGVPVEDNIAIAAKFTTETNMAVRITVVGGTGEMAATDVLITGTARNETTGTQVATDFQTNLQAAVGTSMTVTWSNFYFTIDTLDATSITFEAPTTTTYVDARDLLGLPTSPTLTDYSFDGNFPTDCTMEATLPTDIIQIERVEWDNNLLRPLPRNYFVSPESSGTPCYYNVRGDNIRLYPTPTTDKLLHIEYRGLPSESQEVFQGYQELGLSNITGATATGLSAATTYYYKIQIDGEAQTEYSITTGANTNWGAVATLMNAENTGATWTAVAGDVRCTSDTVTDGSAIALAAGTTGTDLFATLTGFTAFDTAVPRSINLPSSIPVAYHNAIAYLTASKLKLELNEWKEANQLYAHYKQLVNKYKMNRYNQDTETRISRRVGRLPEVSI